MGTSFTWPCWTLSRNSVKVSGCSLRPWPVRTTAKSRTARQIMTTQKIAVLILEFTTPPLPGYTLIDAAGLPLDSDFLDFQKLPASGLGCKAGRCTEAADPNDALAVSQNRPMAPVPEWDPKLLKKGFYL